MSSSQSKEIKSNLDLIEIDTKLKFPPNHPPQTLEKLLISHNKMDLDETFTEASDGYSVQSDTISRFIKNAPNFLLNIF